MFHLIPVPRLVFFFLRAIARGKKYRKYERMEERKGKETPLPKSLLPCVDAIEMLTTHVTRIS